MMKELDKKGFVFLDSANRPYLCRLWNGKPWLFYWHKQNCWVSLRPVSQNDIWTFPRNLSEEQQEVYHNQHRKWENETMKTIPNCGVAIDRAAGGSIRRTNMPKVMTFNCCDGCIRWDDESGCDHPEIPDLKDIGIDKFIQFNAVCPYCLED